MNMDYGIIGLMTRDYVQVYFRVISSDHNYETLKHKKNPIE